MPDTRKAERRQGQAVDELHRVGQLLAGVMRRLVVLHRHTEGTPDEGKVLDVMEHTSAATRALLGGEDGEHAGQ